MESAELQRFFYSMRDPLGRSPGGLLVSCVSTPTYLSTVPDTVRAGTRPNTYRDSRFRGFRSGDQVQPSGLCGLSNNVLSKFFCFLFSESPGLIAPWHPGTRFYTTPEPSARAIPSRRKPVSVCTVFMVILWRKRLPIMTPANAARMPVRINGY